MPNLATDRKVISWALYDWANSAYATTVMAGFFPIFFKEYWNVGVEATTSTFRLGLANSIASLIIVAMAPLLGAIGDQGGVKKKFLLFFAAMGVVMTGSLFFVARGAWHIAVLIYIVGIIGFSASNVFYDSLLISVAPSGKEDMVSALGFGLGYLGGGLLFACNVLMTLKPAWFGLTDAATAVRISFLSVALWWAIFSLPIMIWVKEPPTHRKTSGWKMIGSGLLQLKTTFAEIRKLRVVFLFLIAYWLYIDGVDTIVRMAVDYGMSLGFPADSLIVALLIVQFVGFPAAILFGKLGEKLGTKTSILLGLGVYIGVTVWGRFMDSPGEFYVLAVAIGLVQGGVQSLSRAFYSRIIPANRAAEFFGFYNMLGKFAAVIGPVLMGLVGVLTGNPRHSILAIAVLFLGGGIILYFVDESEGIRIARELEQKNGMG
ncbi:MAG: MFS transporter [Deltaproteobacteria bacterium]|nr:MAG: MFS transporter [Deltaproteobacteria bacterium]